jgi:hypothetical protein
MPKRLSIILLLGLLALTTSAIYAQSSHSADVPSCTLAVDCASGEFGLSDAELEAYPEPNIRQIYADQSIVFDRRYRRVNGAVNFHDAPNGNVVTGLDNGYNFVTLMNEQDGWSQIAPDRWVPTSSLISDVTPSTYAGIYLPEEPLPYTVAWLLVHLRPSTYPGGEANANYPLMLRYTLISIYDMVEVEGWRWYQIGKDQWVKQTQVAKVLPVERSDEIDTERWISIDLYEQILIAYEDESPVFATLISSGLSEWATREGLFHVYIRYPRTIMSGAYGRPEFYYLQEVPWTMYFDGDIAVHGAYWHDGFGYRRSRGCVNMSVQDAYLLYQWASPEFDFSVPNDTGPAVYVYSSGEYR